MASWEVVLWERGRQRGGRRASRIAGRQGEGWIHIHESFDYWQAGWEQVQAGAQAAGRDPTRMERSL